MTTTAMVVVAESTTRGEDLCGFVLGENGGQRCHVEICALRIALKVMMIRMCHFCSDDDVLGHSRIDMNPCIYVIIQVPTRYGNA